MSSAPTPPTALVPPAAAGPVPRRQITLISHSMLFYWWPIWLLGYVFGTITYFEDHRLAILPADSRLEVNEGASDKDVTAYTLKVKNPTTKSLEGAARVTSTPGEKDPFKARMSQKAWMGPLFCFILLITVIITNVPLRGVWSFVVLLLLLVIALGIAMVPGGYDSLMAAVGNLHVYINMAGYFFIATAVLLLWAVSVFIFDQRTYMVVTPGHIAVCEHIGASIRDINGDRVEVEKRRDDMFRHWLLGFFSGDIILKLTDTKEEIRLPNVLWIGWRIEDVRRLIREKATVSHG